MNQVRVGSQSRGGIGRHTSRSRATLVMSDGVHFGEAIGIVLEEPRGQEGLALARLIARDTETMLELDYSGADPMACLWYAMRKHGVRFSYVGITR